MKGIIYSITCTENGKKYVGQTKSHKMPKMEKYGAKGRFRYHIQEAQKNKPSKRPIVLAIREHGKNAFIVETLKTCSLEERDKWEAYYIQELRTIEPDGYNSRKYSHSVGSGATHSKENVSFVEIKPIKHKGEFLLARLYIELRDSKKRDRLDFGQAEKSYEAACANARKYALLICEQDKILDMTQDVEECFVKHERKLRELEKMDIVKLRIGPFGKHCVRVFMSERKK